MTETAYHNRETLTSFNPLKRWVFYTGKPLDSKIDKQPLNPRNGRPASNTKPATWGTRADAEKQAKTIRKAGWKPGVGVVLGDGLCGVDFDGCLKDGVLEPWAEAILDRLDTYAEISPSGNGVKAFFRVADLDAVRKTIGAEHKKSWMKGEHHGVEIHLSNSYYVVTGQEYGSGLVGDYLRLVPLADVRAVVAAAERFKGKTRDESGSGVAYRFCLGLAIYGLTADEIEADLRADTGEAGEWAARSDERQIERCIARALADANQYDRRMDRFDDLMGEAIDGFDLDENGVIRAFTQRHKDELRFDHDAGKWFQFDGNYWRREETKLALHYARAASMDLADDKAKHLKRVSTWEAVERGSRSERAFAVKADIWNGDKMLLGTPGGTVDLRTGELRPGRPDDYINRVTAVAPIPDFQPERDCPRWLGFLNEALVGDKDAIRLAQQWFGYTLTGDTKEQKLVFVYGPGGSGKSTAVETIGKLMGDYATTVAMEVLTASKYDRHPTEIAALRGARMVWASETEKGRAWAENRIKQLTGGDTLKARFMRQDEFTFLPEFKLSVVGNNRPSLRDVDAAIKRRFVIVPFEHPPQHKDTDLPEKLKTEWPGILSWLIVGCLDWQANGLIRPAVVEEATESYFAEQDTFGQWLSDECDVGPQHADTTEALWASWQRFAYGCGVDPGNQNVTFSETLKQRGFVRADKIGPNRKRGWKGLCAHDREFE